MCWKYHLSWSRICVIAQSSEIKCPPSILNSGNVPDIPTFPCMQNYVVALRTSLLRKCARHFKFHVFRKCTWKFTYPTIGKFHLTSDFLCRGNVCEIPSVLCIRNVHEISSVLCIQKMCRKLCPILVSENVKEIWKFPAIGKCTWNWKFPGDFKGLETQDYFQWRL